MSSEGDGGERVLAGGCWCGAVRYRVADAFLYASNCHCSRCRAATGSAFKAFAGIERDKLELTEGLDELLVVGDDDLNDTRCRACGSLLFSVCGKVSTSMSRWARSWTRRGCGRRSTSSSAPRRPGSRSPTSCRSSRSTRSDPRPHEHERRRLRDHSERLAGADRRSGLRLRSEPRDSGVPREL